MRRTLGLLVAATIIAGCRAQAPTVNPFPLSQQRVPPPGTGQATTGLAPPYYSNTPGAAPLQVTPGVVTPPPTSPQGQQWTPRSGYLTDPNSPTGATATNVIRADGGVVDLDRQTPVVPVSATTGSASDASVQFPVTVASAPAFKESAIRIPADTQDLVPRREGATDPAAASPTANPSAGGAADPRQAFVQTLEPRNAAAAAQAAQSQVNAAANYANQQQFFYQQQRLQQQAYQQQAYQQQAYQQQAQRQQPVFGRAARGQAPNYGYQAMATGRSQPTLAPPEGSTAGTAASAASSATTVASAAAGGVIQASYTSAGDAAKSNSSTASNAPAPVSRYGYQSEYQWLKGKLEYSSTSQEWKLRYIPIDGDTDKYGGSVLIANPDALGNAQSGDFVTLEGTIQTASGDSGSYAPTYQVQRVKPIAE